MYFNFHLSTCITNLLCVLYVQSCSTVSSERCPSGLYFTYNPVVQYPPSAVLADCTLHTILQYSILRALSQRTVLYVQSCSTVSSERCPSGLYFTSDRYSYSQGFSTLYFTILVLASCTGVVQLQFCTAFASTVHSKSKVYLHTF